MLALSRKPSQSIQIGPDITVYIVAVHGSNVRISIEAPRDIEILRSELIPVNYSLIPANYSAEARNLDVAVDAAIRETPSVTAATSAELIESYGEAAK